MESFNQLLRERFENNQSKMARVLGINRYQLNSVLKYNGKNAGKKIIAAIIKYCDIIEIDIHKYIFLK